MPVDAINSTNSLLPTALQAQVPTAVPLATSPLNIVTNPVAVAVAAMQNLTPTQQAALLGSEALQTLNLEPTFPAEPLLANGTTPDLTTVLESQGLSPAQQAALAVNETVQTALETQNLTPAQQAALTVNQAVQTLAAPLVPPETTIPAATPGNVAQNPTPGLLDTLLMEVTAADLAAGAVTQGVTTATPTQITTPTTERAVAGEGLNPAQPTASQPIPYSNAVAIYEIRDPNPAPAEPRPRRKELLPLLPIGRVRPVDRLVLRQEWENRKKNRVTENEPREEIQPPQPLAEKSIRQMVGKANADLAANGLPIRLVLAKSDEGYALDIYDCSDKAVCRLAQEVSIDLNKLLTILDNLQHETGILVNIMT